MSDREEKELFADPLFVGLTRPTMVLGVTYQAGLFNLMVTVIVFIYTKNPLHLGIAIPIHAVCYAICLNDPRAFELIALWAQTKAACANRFFWKASSYSPSTLEKRKF